MAYVVVTVIPAHVLLLVIITAYALNEVSEPACVKQVACMRLLDK
jgi:hypothetical protein